MGEAIHAETFRQVMQCIMDLRGIIVWRRICADAAEPTTPDTLGLRPVAPNLSLATNITCSAP